MFVCAQLNVESLLFVVGPTTAEAAAILQSQTAAVAAAAASAQRRTTTADVCPGCPPSLLLGRVAGLTFKTCGSRKALDMILKVCSILLCN